MIPCTLEQYCSVIILLCTYVGIIAVSNIHVSSVCAYTYVFTYLCTYKKTLTDVHLVVKYVICLNCDQMSLNVSCCIPRLLHKIYLFLVPLCTYVYSDIMIALLWISSMEFSSHRNFNGWRIPLNLSTRCYLAK